MNERLLSVRAVAETRRFRGLRALGANIFERPVCFAKQPVARAGSRIELSVLGNSRIEEKGTFWQRRRAKYIDFR